MWNELLNVYTISSLLHLNEYDVLIEFNEKCLGVLSLYKLTNAFTVRGNIHGLRRLLPEASKLKGYWCYAILPYDMFIVRRFVGVGTIEEDYLMTVNKHYFKPKLTKCVKVLTENDLCQIPKEKSVPYGEKEITYLVKEGRVYGSFTKENELASLAFIQDESINVALIGGVYTKPRFRRQGYAKSCLSKLINDLLLKHKIVGLTVSVNNLPAVNLYKSLGFKVYTKLFSFEVI